MPASAECPGCGSAGGRWLTRFPARHGYVHLLQCPSLECRLVFREGPGHAAPPEGGATRGHATSMAAEKALLRGLRECLRPAARLGAFGAAGELRTLLEGAGYGLGGDDADAVLITEDLQASPRPRALLEDLRERLSPGGSLVVHLRRFEDLREMARRGFGRPFFRPQYVSYFGWYALASLLRRSGLLVGESFLDEGTSGESWITVRASSQAEVAPPAGGWNRLSDSPGR